MAPPYTVPLFRIPTQPSQAQSFGVTLNGREYRFRLTYNDAQEGGWVLDIGGEDGAPIVCGIPVLPGMNLLEPYGHLSIGGGGALFVYGPGTNDAAPTFEGLGAAWQLYFAPPTDPLGPYSGAGFAFIPTTYLAATEGAQVAQVRSAR